MTPSGTMKRLILVVGIVVFAGATAMAQETTDPGNTSGSPSTMDSPPPEEKAGSALEDDLSPAIKIVLLLTALTVLPAILMTVTSFTRIIIVLGFVRRALSVQDAPPNQVMIGLAFFLTLLIMSPIISEINDKAVQPYLSEDPETKIDLGEAADRASTALSGFLLEQTREDEILVMIDVTGIDKPETPEDVPLHVLIPSFALSELRTAFQMGFLIYLPFLIVDLVVASILLSMGMFMLPPVIISTPFKILLFVLVDGWDIVVQSLLQSFVT